MTNYSLGDIRQKLGSVHRNWRSLDAVAETDAFQSFLAAEFPALLNQSNKADRRHFLKLMAASFAMAGLSGCDDGDGRDQEVPYVRNPTHQRPGEALSYASSATLDGFANGILVTTRNGRPIKIEGNPQHPWSRGGTDIFAQASVLELYDPLRSQSTQYLSRPSQWESFRSAMRGRFNALAATGGRGFRLLTGPMSSPSLLAQIQFMRAKFPEMVWHSYAPVDRAAVYRATNAVFGHALEPRARFDQAQVIVSLGGDFLDPGPWQTGVARAWSQARRAAYQQGKLLTMYSASPVPNLTSAKADAHEPLRQDELINFAKSLTDPSSSHADGTWQSRASAALRAAKGKSLVIAGSTQPEELHQVVHHINTLLGNIGAAVFYTAPACTDGAPLAALVDDMAAGNVDMLLMLGVNPGYDAPADLQFADHLSRVALKIHAGLYVDETAAYADWHLPLAHPLESWGDMRAFDGTISLIQPTVRPFYDGRSAQEILSMVDDQPPQDALSLLKTHYQSTEAEEPFAERWQRMLQAGYIADTALPEQNPQPVTALTLPTITNQSGIDVVFQPDPTIWDGARANNGWLQELPKPLTKMVWENVIGVSPALAERERVQTGEMAAIQVDGQRLAGPIWIMPGQADNTVSISLGYGRPEPDMLFSGYGYNAYLLRKSTTPWFRSGATLKSLHRNQELATTDNHNAIGATPEFRVQVLGAAPVGDGNAPQPTLYALNDRNAERSWGMVIDTDACIGCNACVVACQAENNIPIVGREQVALGREMHWLRVDRIYRGNLDAPETYFMPIPCMHCEQAPCEVGCPVEATLHDREGLNLQVYNRCIGTRACSSYCPYKVRHFNYLDYTSDVAPSIQAQRNPEVSVRARGVMEKCTYCVQRIAEARIIADKDNAPIADGSVRTACQGACPTQAIAFGDISDAKSEVVAARADPRHYALLKELNTRPRTTYLASLAPPKLAEG